ncbi:mannosyltransferase family protein [Streptomyces sp. TRM64462]|uniref:mannosyltransferase family protein n=1 Tax=Streptomyces sp. TRM64462 TaxID=2741726 RepID=UPI0028150EB2|nr:mannosyltransferase family protein [Streptomyces sp. TRM64462]
MFPDRTAPPPEAPDPPPHRGSGPALLGYAAVRLVGLAVLLVAASAAGEDAWHRLKGRWDAVWYTRIAEHGYGYEVTLPDGGGVHSDLAFFPLLPALERALSAVLPVSPATAGLLVSWTAALAAAWGIHAVGAHIAGPRAGVVLAVLWGVYPTAFVQSMAYTESLFTAFAAWSLYAVLRGRWVTAGALSALAGLTRPSAVALVAALGVTALATVAARRRGPERLGPVPLVPVPLVPEPLVPVPLVPVPLVPVPLIAGMLLAPLGWLAYAAFVAVRLGSPTAYFDVQAAWGNRVDGGVALARFVAAQLTGPHPLAGVGLIAAFGLLGWALWLCVRQRQPLPVLVYTLVIVAVSLVGAAYFGSRPRLIMPAFPLLLPAAVALARLRDRYLAAVLAALALASAVYGAFTLLGPGPP